MQGTLLVEALFVLHHGHIAAHHCEDRHNPESDCNGKCFLAKRVGEVHDAHGSDDGTARLTMRAPVVDLTATWRPSLIVPPAPSSVHPYPAFEPAHLPDAPPDDIFRPPWTA
jgi:hypothetical protein